MSYNALVAAAVEHFALQDDNSNPEILDSASSINGTLTSGNTNDASVSGPTAWLQKAIRLNGTTDHITFVDLPTALNNKSEWTISVWWKSTDTASREKVIYSVGGSASSRMSRVSPGYNKLTPVFIHGRVIQNGSLANESFTTPIDTSTWRHQAWVKHLGGYVEIFEDGVSVGTSGSDIPIWDGITKHGIGIDIHAANSPWPGDLADLIVSGSEYSSTDIAELMAGPEPVNTVAPTLLIDGSGNWTGSVGTWSLPAPFAAGSNGTITYAWELRLDSDDSVVSSGSGASPSGSGLSADTDYYLHVVAMNDGDDDLPAESTRESYTAPSGITVTPSTANLTTTTYAPTATTPVTATPNTVALTTAGLVPTVALPITTIPSTLELATTLYVPNIATPKTIVPGTTSLTTELFVPTINNPATVVPNTDVLTTTTFAPTVSAPQTVVPDTKTLSITTYVPDVAIDKTIVPGTRALVLSMYVPTVLTPRTVTPDTVGLAITTYAPTLEAGTTVTANTAILTITGLPPEIVASVTVTPNSIELTLTSFIPSTQQPLNVVTLTGNLSITEYAPTIQAPQVLTPDTLELELTTYEPFLGTETPLSNYYYYLLQG